MIVVADTTPLRYLVRVGQVDLLESLYKRLVVPEAVLAELQHARTPEIVRRWAESPPSWIEPRSVSVSANELRNLGPGERAAITLAESDPQSLLIIDERAASKQAAAREISVIGTLGVLESGFRVSERLYALLIERHRDRGRTSTRER